MVEQVHWKREHSGPRSKTRFSVLGDGLLDRTRSTTLGLLGMTAAIGLAIIAVALQENWPLVAGSPVPRAPVLHESVGDAVALSGSRPRTVVRPASAKRKRSIASHKRQMPVPAGPPAAPPVGSPAELVSSPATPVVHEGGHGHGSHGSPTPQEQAPPQPVQAQAPSGGAPTTQPSTSPTPEPPSPPEAIASEAPPAESNVPPWSHGQGHAYGRDDGEEHGCGHGPGGRAGD